MRPERIQLLSDVNSMFADVDYAYFISYKGLNVVKFREFRAELAKSEATCKVLKNTIIRKAFEAKGFTDSQEIASLKTDTAVVFGKGEGSAIAKVIKKFGEANTMVQAKCGLMEGAIVDAAYVNLIADLPSKDALRAQFLGVINAPVQNFVNVLDAVIKKQEEQNSDS